MTVLNLYTGICLRSGTETQLGDILSALNVHDTVVMIDEKTGKFIAKVISEDDIYFDLDDFVTNWSKLKVTGNINHYKFKQ